MSAITAKASRKMKKYAVLTREPRCFLGSFDFSWEQRKLGELGTITTGNTPSTSIPDYYSDDGIVWVTPTDICENITFESARKLSDLGQQVGRVVPKNTILVTCIASIGKNTMLGNTGSFNQQINGLTPNENKYDPYFLLTESALWSAKMKGSAAAGTMQIVNRTEFSELKTWLPSLIEQQAIGAFFKQLDHLITLHQRKCVFLFSFFRACISMNFTASTFSWEQRKLEDYLTVSAEKNTGNIYGRSDVLSVSGDYGIVNQIEFQGRSFAGALVSNYGVVQTGDVVYTKSPLKSNPYGIIKTNKGKPGIVSTLYAVYHPKENAFSDFIQVYFEQHARMNNYMHPLVNKGAKNDMKVSAENALKGPVCFPSRIEQESISAFFSVLDNLITLHQRECISFTGSAGRLILTANKKRTASSWEQRKLGEMGQTYTGLSGKTKDDFGHGQARFVTYMNVFSNPISNPEMTEPIEIDPKQNEVEVGDVFFTTSSETPEEVGMSSILLEKRGKTYLNSFCFGFRPSEKIDSYYLAYMLRSESTRAKIILLAQGISRYNISKNKVMEIAVSLPSLDEQKMIGQYFSQLDNLITLHQRKPFLMKWRTSDANRNQTNRLVL